MTSFAAAPSVMILRANGQLIGLQEFRNDPPPRYLGTRIPCGEGD
jgi:hypothetical protein